MHKFEIMSLFPKTIAASNIDRPFTAKEMSNVSVLMRDTIQNKHNLRTKKSHVLDEYFPNIKNFIEQAIKHYSTEVLNLHDVTQLYITQSWINFTKPGEEHHRHGYSNSIISGVLYFNADPTFDSICFMDSSYSQIKLTPKAYNQYNSTMTKISVKTGDFILFPSSLEHMVPKTTGQDMRISLAFNTFVRGELGNELELCHVKL